MRLSFVVPAHDEAAMIGATVAAIVRAAEAVGEPYEVIVVDDSSTDGTGALAEAAGARVVRTEVRQISRARNAGAAVATGDTLVFVDADTLVSVEVLQELVCARRDGVVAGGATIRFDEPTPRFVKVMTAVFLVMARTLRMAAGCFFFCARDAFNEVGGFDATMYAAEEIDLSRKLRRRGRFLILKSVVTTSGRKARTHSHGELWRSFLAIAIRPRIVRERSRLALWYGPRRRDEK
jgi:glycosyltransferase involved in cell wall biosynthesis